MTDTTQDPAAALAAEEAAKAAAKEARDAGLPDDLADEDMADVLTDEELALLRPEPEPVAAAEPEAPAVEPAPEAAAPTDEALSAWDAPDPVLPTMPPVPADAEAKIAELEGALDGLLEKFEEGEITQDEFRRQQKDLIARQSAAQVTLERARRAEEQAAGAAQAYIDAWAKKLDAYRAEHGYLWDQAHVARWDANVRAVNANPAYATLPMADRIQLAHRLYAAEYEIAAKKPLPTQPGLKRAAEAKPAAAVADGPSKEPRPDPVQTLAGFPSAASITVDDGKFAAIDRVMPADPLRAEALLASLSEAEMAAYLT